MAFGAMTHCGRGPLGHLQMREPPPESLVSCVVLKPVVECNSHTAPLQLYKHTAELFGARLITLRFELHNLLFELLDLGHHYIGYIREFGMPAANVMGAVAAETAAEAEAAAKDLQGSASESKCRLC